MFWSNCSATAWGLTAGAILLCLGFCPTMPAGAQTLQGGVPVQGRGLPAQTVSVQSFSIDRLPAPLPSLSNRWADNPQARALGAALFMDPGLSQTGQVSCASCHQPERSFSDGQPLARGVAGAVANRHTPTLYAAPWSRWQGWAGKADSVWAQSINPLLDPKEHGLTIQTLCQRVADHYARAYAELFGPLRVGTLRQQQEVVAHVGKALEAYIRTLRPPANRLDAFLAGQAALSKDEQMGFAVFTGKGQCIRCHSGPLYTNHSFHNTGVASRLSADAPGAWVDGVLQADTGRASGIVQAQASIYRCGGVLSDVPQVQHKAMGTACQHLRYVNLLSADLVGAYKVPSLRRVSKTAPYMHDGRFSTLEQVVQHYVQAPNPDGDYGHTELLPLNLSSEEQRQLVSFLKVL